MRRHRSDANQAPGVEHLKAAGWSVAITSQVGDGFPDTVCARDLFTALVEWKDGAKPPSARALSEDQKRFRDAWSGVYIVALNPEHALLQLEAWRAKVSK